MKESNLREALKGKLTDKEYKFLPSSYDIIGILLVFSDFPKVLNKKEKLIADEMLKLHPHVKTILKKTENFSGKYRLPKYKVIAGQKTKETLYKENNVRLKLDIEKIYFSPRLSTERKRIASSVKKGEDILVMFSGAAPYPLVISKNSKAKEIVGIELNPVAHKYGLENIALNKISNVRLIKGDVRKVVPKLNKKFDRIAMPLPKGAENFLYLALGKIKRSGIIHFYTFSEEDKYDGIIRLIKEKCKKCGKSCKITKIVKCGAFSPKVFRICFDIKVFY